MVAFEKVAIALVVIVAFGLPGHILVDRQIFIAHMKPFQHDQLEGRFLFLFFQSSVADIVTVCVKFGFTTLPQLNAYVPSDELAAIGVNLIRYFYLLQVTNFVLMVINRYTSGYHYNTAYQTIFNNNVYRRIAYAIQFAFPFLLGALFYSTTVKYEYVNGSAVAVINSQWPQLLHGDMIALIYASTILIVAIPCLCALLKRPKNCMSTQLKRQIHREQMSYLVARWLMILFTIIVIALNASLAHFSPVNCSDIYLLSQIVFEFFGALSGWIQLAVCRNVRRSVKHIFFKNKNAVKAINLRSLNGIVSNARTTETKF